MLSLGLPVYNGENYLKESIQSILNQTFREFELIICDNASIDGTESICREFATKDRRIKYYRNSKNIGAGPNFNLSFQKSTGKYFKWVAHDDICEPEYLEKCIDVLEHDESVVLCHSDLIWIDSESRPITERETLLPGLDSNDLKMRFKQLISTKHSCFDVFGVIRRDVLEKTSLIASFIGSDRSLLAEIGLYGRITRVPEVLFLSRDHLERSIRAMRKHERAKWWDTTLSKKNYYPWWRLLREMIAIINRVPMDLLQKLRCYLIVPSWILQHRRLLLREIFMFFIAFAKRSK